MEETWEQYRNYFINPPLEIRKQGVDLYLLDRLNPAERFNAERDLTAHLTTKDSWPVEALTHLKSSYALPKLYELHEHSKGVVRIKIAYAIYQISPNDSIIDSVLEEVDQISSIHELTDIFYVLVKFPSEQIHSIVQKHRKSEVYELAYHSTVALGISPNRIIGKFRKK